MVKCTSFSFSSLYLCGWLSFDGGADFNKGCDCLQSEATREEDRSATFSYGGKKIAWAFERPLFCSEHMVLNHYLNN